MAGASDKARFYLEQSVPELREWERRNIFSKEEIASINSKRSDFEHTLNARGSSPADYARYVGYEMNLDLLRRKRVKRLGVKATAHTGQRKIFNVLERGTKKFPGDLGLWMQYLEYARKQKANKKINRILTDVLRLHPSKPELWIMAAKYAMEVQGDMTSARGYMQRGLRFCKRSRALYVEYAKLEMLYIAKLHARWTVLGLTTTPSRAEEQTSLPSEEDVIGLAMADHDATDEASTETSLLKTSVLDQLKSSGILDGAIPIAVFDAAMKQFQSELPLIDRFVDVIAEFSNVPCAAVVAQHVFKCANEVNASSTTAVSLHCRLPCIGLSTGSPEYAAGLREVLKRIKIGLKDSPKPDALSAALAHWIGPLTQDSSLPVELKLILNNTLRQLEPSDAAD